MDTSEQLFLNKLLAALAEYKASDLHLVAGNFPILRVNGKLIPLNHEQPINFNFLNTIVQTWLNDEQKKILAKDKSIVFSYTASNKMRFRVGVYYQKGSLSISLKLIPQSLRSLDELGVPLALQQAVELNKGLIIVAGPFGSGKTTTQAALIESINQSKSKHIITIEKPIEYLFADSQSVIEQREIGNDTPSAVEALKFVADEDVDIVSLSSLEGKIVVEEVCRVVDSGRLVIAAVNTESVTQTLENIVNNFLPAERQSIQEKLARILVGIVVQKVVPNLQGSSSLAYELFFPEDDQNARAIVSAGEFAKINNVMDTSTKPGLISFDRCLANMANNSQISLNIALQNAHDKDYFRSLISS